MRTVNYSSVWRKIGKKPPKGSGRIVSRLSKGAKVSPFYDISSTVAELEVLWKTILRNPIYST
jgi:hypothetical protein